MLQELKFIPTPIWGLALASPRAPGTEHQAPVHAIRSGPRQATHPSDSLRFRLTASRLQARD